MNTTFQHPVPQISRKWVIAAILLLAAIVLMTSASAGVTGEEFKDTYDTIVKWISGYLGKVLAVVSFVIGCAIASARQNLMPAVFGMGLALLISFGPGLINSVLTATV